MTRRGAPPPRIAIAFQGDATDPDSWSGVPAGLWRGLAEAGFDRVAIDARLPGYASLAHRLRLSWAEATANPLFAAGAGIAAGRAASRAGVDSAIAIGSGFALPARLRAVTFEDMTVAQAMRTGDPVYQSLSERAKRRWLARQRRAYERSVACCVASHWAADSVVEEYGVPRERVHVVGLGAKMPFARNPPRDWSTPRFVFAGFQWQRKGGPAVLRAFAALRERIPTATLDLVGSHPAVEVEGVRAHGRMALASAGAQHRFAAILDRATCLLMPSVYEPFGIAYADAGSRGVPSIGTTVGGAADAIGPGGVLVAPGDDEELLGAMLTLADGAVAQRLGARANEYAEGLSWDRVTERLVRALQPPGVDAEALTQYLPRPSVSSWHDL
ncbi:MAG: glycosyltransferase family 4 protein [Solirubrobacterales bacterium]